MNEPESQAPADCARRFLCFFFPRWPMQRLLRTEPELRGKAAAVYERGAHGPRVVACSQEASALGVARGMPVSEATAIAPELLVSEIDRARDRAALEQLALWAGRFSPWTGVELCGPGVGEHPQALILEITGCQQVFGGEEKLLQQALQGLARQQLRARAAIAPTLSAAWALAHYGTHRTIAPQAPDAALEAALAPLPLPALRLPPEAVAWLSKLGLQTIGDVLKQPRATLPSRFGPELIERLDQALGSAAETFPWLRPPPEVYSTQSFEYAVSDRELLLHAIERRLAVVVRELHRRCRGARSLECWLYREAAEPVLLEVHLFRSSASQKHLLQLIRTRLEDLRFTSDRPKPALQAGRPHHNGSDNAFSKTIDVDAGFCALAVWVTASELLDAEQLALFSKPRGAPSGLAMTLDRIRTHCGRASVFRVTPADEIQPEFAYTLADGEQERAAATATDPEALPPVRPEFSARPLQLLPEPAPINVDWPAELPAPRSFEWKQERIAIASANGPERIETGWWRGGTQVRRDYYTVTSPRDERFWIFRDLKNEQWYLHGVFE